MSVIIILNLAGALTMASALTVESDLLLHVQGMTKRLEALENVVSAQNEKLARQDEQLFHQGMLLALQSSRLQQQDLKLDQQNIKLQGQEDVLKSQGAELTDIKVILLKAHQNQNQEVSTVFNQTPVLAEEPEVEPSEVQQGILNETVNIGETNAVVSSLDVNVRSDDSGPLEAVVNQISQKVMQIEADIQILRNSDTQKTLDIKDARTSMFVHWGSSHCSSSAETVYSGVIGGSFYDHSGAATNYLCLTMSPVFSNHSIPAVIAYLYGSEYETLTSQEHFQSDPVCAVCRSSFSTTVMTPGTNVCAPGWHVQYSGYLMAGHYLHAAGSEYICVDSSLESRPNSQLDQNGVLLYFTVTQCGSLPCSPYENNKVVLCAVCSR